MEDEGEGPDQEARQKLEDLKRQLGALDDARARVDEPSTESGDQVIAQSISRSGLTRVTEQVTGGTCRVRSCCKYQVVQEPSPQSLSCRIAGQLTDIEQRLEDVDDSTSELLADSTKAWLQPQESQPSHAQPANGHQQK